NNKLTAPMIVGIRIEGLPGATLDMDGMDHIDLAPQERIKLLARVQIPSVQEDHKEKEDHKGKEDHEGK
ncbi:MAG TPA: hypothetical protein DCS21_05535, partial [Gammaproteobacteria bacterium]|nr:hypothetical protein [Gammaproteobacteria bacterium]